MLKRHRLYLHPNGYYYHRVKVPADIRSLYGKQIEQISLKTRDFRDAVRRLPAVIVNVDNGFAQFRTDHNDDLVLFASSSGSRVKGNPAFKRIVADHANSVEAEEMGRRSAAFRAASDDLEAYLHQISLPIGYGAFIEDCRKQNDLASLLSLVNRLHVTARMAAIKQAKETGAFHEWDIIAKRQIPDLSTVRRAILVKALMDAELKALHAWQEFLPYEMISLGTTEVSISKSTSGDLPLMSIISNECFNLVGREKKWSAKTDATRRSQIKQFIDICGDKPLNRYTQNDIRLLKSTLFAVPPQSHGRKELKGLSRIQIAEQAKKLGLSGLSSESVRQIMTAANIVFGWSRTEYDHALQNIVQPMIPPPSRNGSKKDKRHGFTSDELNKLFRSPVFTGVRTEKSWYDPGDISMHSHGRFWVPLLALFAGARLMEVVQLMREDIGCEDGIWFIDINDHEEEQTGKRVKNESSLRNIPVHPTLIELGFIDFVQTIPNGNRLFPDIPIGPATQRHRHASKMFNKLLGKARIKGPKKVWHSLRHSFEQACRDSRVDSAIMDQLQGHSQKGMRGVYGDGYGLTLLYEGIRSIVYSKLDLSCIQPFRSHRPGDRDSLVVCNALRINKVLL
ncbi:site-specific integrase [Agrobacterium sp. FDAARGOS_525]|nr:site-specific integrase [Agrobacterium sp. FDAARGOS_525]